MNSKFTMVLTTAALLLFIGGGAPRAYANGRDRTGDLFVANDALSQLSYRTCAPSL